MTGLTSLVAENDNVTLEQFAMRCARNFGALIDMRDEPMDAPIPEEFEVDEYYRKNYERAKAEYDNFISNPPTDDELEKKYNEYVAEEKEKARKENEKRRIIRERYEDMLAKVIAWQPPTEEHFKLKEFMERQLIDSLEWDCEEYKPHLITKERFMSNSKESEFLKECMGNSKKSLERAIEAVNSRNKWLKDLRESLRNME